MIHLLSNDLLRLSLVTDGYLGCTGTLIPCLNATDCIEIDQVCLDSHPCVNQDNHSICLYSFLPINID